MSRRRPPHGSASHDQIEGRNPVFEALKASRRIRKVLVDERARPDSKLDSLLGLAAKRRVEIERLPRAELDRMADDRVHNGVIALADPLPRVRLIDLVNDASEDALFLLLDEVQYDQNLGAILRTADAAGVTAVIVPRRRGARLSPVVQRIAMGAAEHVPIVHCAILEALATFRKAGFRIAGAAEGAELAHHEADLRGPLALVVGGEDKGLTPPVRKRCNPLVRIPMTGHVPSLNVSVSVGILLFERLRQMESS